MAETLIEERPNHRRALIQKAVIYLPGGSVATVLFAASVYNVVMGNLGALVAGVILGLIAFAVDYEGIAAVRDLRGAPAATVGSVARKWSKGRFAFFGRVHYLLMERRVFEVNAATAMEIREGDRVRVEHWPHTNTVIAVYRLPSTSDSRGATATSR